MWNFQIPWYLKRWLDCVVQARLTFGVSEAGYEGLLKGRACVILTTRDGMYGPGSPMESLDFQLPYLKHILGFMGLGPVHIVNADGMAYPVREESLVNAVEAAKTLANTITR
jgi:FMN-dependent NADH-azoreductase